MRRFAFSSLPEKGTEFSAPEVMLRHLCAVLRVQAGDRIEASCGDGTLALLEVVRASSDAVVFSVLSKTAGGEIPLKTCAFLAELKNDAMDEAVGLLAETGVSQIRPFFAERSTPKYDSKDTLKKQARRQKVAEEAVKKVGGLYSCRVLSSLPFAKLEGWDLFPNKILFYEQTGGAADLSAFDFSQESAFFIGPEGGFSPEEAGILQTGGFACASLGTRILRAPTACAAAAILIRQYTEKRQNNDNLDSPKSYG